MTLHSDEMRHIDEAPEQRRRLVRTRAGIIIGSAFVPPPHAASADAERIQSALLDPATAGRLPLPRRIWRRVVRWL